MDDHTPPAQCEWWRWAGWGWPVTLREVRLRDTLTVLLVALTVWSYVDIRNRGAVVPAHPEWHRTDFTVFTEAGAAFFDGRDPYQVTNLRGWYYLYPPLFALIVAPLACFDCQTQVVVWFWACAAMGVGCYVESRRLWRAALPDAIEPTVGLNQKTTLGRLVAAGAILAVVLPTFDCMQRGQLGIALVYPLLLGARLALTGRTRWAVGLGGVVLVWPVVVKLIPALPVGCLCASFWSNAVGRHVRPAEAARASALTVGGAVGLLLFVLLIPAACVGWKANLRHLGVWVQKVAANEEVGAVHGFHIDSATNQSLGNAIHLFAAQVNGRAVKRSEYPNWFFHDTEVARRRGEAGVTEAVVRVARGVALGMLAVLLVLSRRRAGPAAQFGVFGLSCVALLLVSPLAWGHYYVLWLPAVVGVGVWGVSRDATRATAWLVIVPAVLTWAHYLSQRSLGEYGLLGLGTAVWFVSAWAFGIGWLFQNKDASDSELRVDERHAATAGRHAIEERVRSF